MNNGFSNDEKHRATLDMLSETLEYLRRLPPVPVTLDFCKRIQAHLDQPTNALVARERDTWVGDMFSPAGLPPLDVKLRGNVLSLQFPAGPKGADLASQEAGVVKAIRAGLTMHLQNLGFELGSKFNGRK